MVRPVLPCCLKSVLLFADAFSPSANAISFLQLNLSLALSCSSTRMLQLGISPRMLSQQDCCCFFFSFSWHLTKISPTSSYPIMGVPTCLNQPHEEGEEFSNLTAEIRLDGWLRFGVSSLTLTLIIKLSFNLHLTN
jgi:hypothetical protein